VKKREVALIILVGTTLGFLLFMLISAGVLRRMTGEEFSFTIWLIITLAWFLAVSSFGLAWMFQQDRSRGLPLALTQEGNFRVLFAETRAIKEKSLWYFLAETKKGLRFLSYPFELVSLKRTDEEMGELEVRRMGDFIKITYHFSILPEEEKAAEDT